MKLVLDTNIFCADYRLQGNAFRILFEVVNRIGVEIFVPQIVFEETIGKFKSTFQDSSLKLERATRDIERLLGEKLGNVSYKDVEETISGYEVFLSERLKSNKVKILPYPQVEHKHIVSRAIKRKKPFKENGDGYRDTLIWFNLLELAKIEKSSIIFVTNNSSDFGKNTLLPDLQNDLTDLGISLDDVKIVTTLDEFNTLFAVPVLQTLDDVIKQLESSLFSGFSLKDWIQNSLLEDLKQWQFEDAFVGIEQDHAKLNFKEITEVKNFVVDDVRLLPSGDFLISATAEIAAEINVHITWEQYESFEDVREFLESDDNEPFSWSSTDIIESAEVSFSLILKEGSQNVISSEIDEVNGAMSVEMNSHPRKST
jgi:predicted nucleic acid-binding protein